MTSEAKKQAYDIVPGSVWCVVIFVAVFLVGLAARSLFPVEIETINTVYVSRPDPQLVSCETLPAVIWEDDQFRLVATAHSAHFFVEDSGYRMEERSNYNALGDRCWIPFGFSTNMLLGLSLRHDRAYLTESRNYELAMPEIPQARAVILAISNCEATRVRP